MSSREIITSPEVGLAYTEDGDYIVSKDGYQSYAIRKDSRTYSIVKILDIRGLAQQRRYECANDVIHQLEFKLECIESNKIYRFFHRLGLI